MDIKAIYKQITLSAIQSISDKKKVDKIYPNYALNTEIERMIVLGVRKIIKEMAESGEIKQGETMNDKYYETK